MPSKAILIVAQLLCALTLAAANWPHWRGPNRNDILDEPSGWSNGKWSLNKPRWTLSVGEGASSPLVNDGRFYVMGWKNGHDVVSAFDTVRGQTLWTATYACPRYGRLATGDQMFFAGPSSTPEYDAETGYLYTLSCDGDLNCWDTLHGGKNVWKLNLYEKYNVPQRPKVERSGRRDYGYTSSPLVSGKWLIVEVGAPAGNLIGFDKLSGTQLWTSEATSPAGHNGGPVPMVVGGIPCVVVHNFDGLLVARLDGEHPGKTVATHPWETWYANNVVTPAVHSNSVIVTSGYNHSKMVRFDISLTGGAKQIWEVPAYSQVCSPVIHDGYVYWAWRQVHCLNFNSGAVLWEGGQVTDPGSMIFTRDQRLVVWANRGDLFLVEGAAGSPSRYLERAARKVSDGADAWPHVVLAGGRLYCKDRAGNLLCFDL